MFQVEYIVKLYHLRNNLSEKLNECHKFLTLMSQKLRKWSLFTIFQNPTAIYLFLGLNNIRSFIFCVLFSLAHSCSQTLTELE